MRCGGGGGGGGGGGQRLRSGVRCNIYPFNEGDNCCKAECDQPYFVALVAIVDKL